MPGGRIEGVPESAPLVVAKKTRGKPRRLVAMQDLARLTLITRPKHIAFGGAGPIVGGHKSETFFRIPGPKSAEPSLRS